MCGACGREARRDEWSAVLSTSRGRWQAAAAVNRFLAEVGHPARLSCSPGAWVLRGSTGRAQVLHTATELWRAVLATRPVDPAQLARLRHQAHTPEEHAVAAAAAASHPGPHPRWS